jgi:hypothetical protein
MDQSGSETENVCGRDASLPRIAEKMKGTKSEEPRQTGNMSHGRDRTFGQDLWAIFP